MRLLACSTACVAIGLLASCRRTTLPDLIPLQNAPGYCEIVGTRPAPRFLRVVVKNQASGFVSQATITHISFPRRQIFAGQAMDLDVPAGSLGPGGEYEHLVPVPENGS